MLTRLIGEDIDLVMVPGTELGCGESRSRADRAGHHEPGGQCARRHAARRQADHRDGQRQLDENYAHVHAPAKPGRVRDAGGQRHRHAAWMPRPRLTSSNRSSPPRVPKGTGLGLSTVYGIVKQSGGYIWVYSEPGKGNDLQDLFAARGGGGRSASRASAPVVQHSLARGHETILLVEDEENLRRLAQAIFAESRLLRAGSRRRQCGPANFRQLTQTGLTCCSLTSSCQE